MYKEKQHMYVKARSVWTATDCVSASRRCDIVVPLIQMLQLTSTLTDPIVADEVLGMMWWRV